MEELAVSLRSVINNAPLSITKSQVKTVLRSLADEELSRYSVNSGPDAAAGAFNNEEVKEDIEGANYSKQTSETTKAPERVGFLMFDPRYRLSYDAILR